MLLGRKTTTKQTNNLRSYQDEYRLVTARTQANFTMLPHWETRPPALCPAIPLSTHYPDTEPTSRSPVLIMPSVWLGTDKYKFLSHWFDSTRRICHSERTRTIGAEDVGRSMKKLVVPAGM